MSQGKIIIGIGICLSAMTLGAVYCLEQGSGELYTEASGYEKYGSWGPTQCARELCRLQYNTNELLLKLINVQKKK